MSQQKINTITSALSDTTQFVLYDKRFYHNRMFVLAETASDTDIQLSRCVADEQFAAFDCDLIGSPISFEVIAKIGRLTEARSLEILENKQGDSKWDVAT